MGSAGIFSGKCPMRYFEDKIYLTSRGCFLIVLTILMGIEGRLKYPDHD